MEKWRSGLMMVVFIVWFTGCSNMQAANEPIVPSAVPTEMPSPTATNIPPTATLAPTLPPPPTFTAEPTLPPPTEAPTEEPTNVPTEVPTELPTEVVDEGDSADIDANSPESISPTPSPNDCLPRDIAAQTTSPLRVTGANWPKPPAWQNEVYAGRGANQLIHIGFDVEGSPEPLAELLDVLDKHQVKTTMFILGNWAEAYPNWIQEFDQRGHEFANHTHTHGNMKNMSAEQVRDELTRVESIVQRLTGKTTKPWLRPPFGSRSDVSLAAAHEAGWTTVIWSGSPEDWRTEFDEDAMCRTLIETSYAGGILYAHTGRPEMPAVIERYIGTMQQRGYTFVPLTVLLSENPSLYLVEN